MLEDGLKGQMRAYFERIKQPVRLTASLDESRKSRELRALLEEIAGLTEAITLDVSGEDPRKPSFSIERVDSDVAVRFAGIPTGHEFNSLVLAILQVGGHPPKESEETLRRIAELEGDYLFETYFSLSCQNCPDVVQALNLMSVVNPRISHAAIDGALFQKEVEARQILAVPSVFLNGRLFAQGRMTLDQIIAQLDKNAARREAAKLTRREPYDVLVVGGGPAGASAAVYAARKGIRTGIVAERFGGQVLDTMAIENFISVSHTEGPKLVASLEQHVRDYAVDIVADQRAAELIPASAPGGLSEVKFASGASLKARALIVATGARWRQLDVPGEDEYRNRGVAYCPHCDGPLFKGKRVAVVGGGNSGVEAAIDLAGLASHVTLLEFDSQLRADAVLQNKLRSLKNVTIYTSAQTSEVHGDGARVTGLSFLDRIGSGMRLLEVEGVFVQIGLIPNTEWLKGAIELSPRGEIEVDDRGQTSAPGVFAAGDATTVAYKQIIIAMGDGAKAALTAFDYLIRLAPPGMSQAA